jgi:hypothetical protein
VTEFDIARRSRNDPIVQILTQGVAMISIRHAPPSDAQLIQWSLDNPGVRFEYVNGVVTVSPSHPTKY